MTYVFKRILAATMVGLLAGIAPAMAQTTPSKALDQVSMRFGYVATGIDVIWAYGKEQNYFRDQGIDIEFREGKGSAVTAQSVAAGSDDFGADIDGGSFLVLGSKGLAATAVLASVAESPLTVLSSEAHPIKTPADLAGKQIAITAGDGPSALLGVLLARNGVDATSVSLVNMQPGPKLTVLLTGRVDGVVTNVVTKAILEGKGLKTHALMYADNGLVTPGQYLVVSNALLTSKPDIVRRVVLAAQKSIEATVADPDTAVEAFARAYPAYDKKTAIQEIKITIGLMKSPSATGKPTGYISMDDAKAGEDALVAAGMMTSGGELTKFLTNRFISRVQTHKVHQTTAATRYTEAAKFAASLS